MRLVILQPYRSAVGDGPCGATGSKVKKQRALRGKGWGGMLRVVVVLLSLAAGLGVAAAQTETVQQGATTQAPADPTSAKSKPTGKQAAPKQAAAKSGPRQAAAPAGSGHCVGVLSRLGVTFTLSKIGIIPLLLNEERRIPIEEWHVDDLVAARVAAFLGNRAVVRRVPWSREAASVPLDRWRLSPPVLRDYEATTGEVARTLAAGMHCTRYVTVTRHGERYGGAVLRGIGIVEHVGGLTVYAHAQVRVYDGETFALLSRTDLSLEPPTLTSLLMGDNHGPHRPVDKALWSPPEQVAPNVKLRDAVRDLVARSLDATLPELKLME
jgi:hypothetical protein